MCVKPSVNPRTLELAKTGRRLLEFRGWKVSRRLGMSWAGSVYVSAVKAGVRLLVRVSDHPVPASLDCGRRVLFCVDVGERHPLRGLVAFSQGISDEIARDEYVAAKVARQHGRSGRPDRRAGVER